MRASFLIVGLGLAALLSAPFARASSFSRVLAEADRVRATQPRQFDELMTELQSRRREATPEERQHLRLLESYRRVLRGDYQTATTDLKALFDSAADPDVKYRAALLIANTSALTRDFLGGLRYLERSGHLADQVSPETRDLGDEVAGTMFIQFGRPSLALQHARALLSRDTTLRSRCVAEHLRYEAAYLITEAVDEDGIQRAILDCASQHETIAVNLLRSTLAQYWAKHGKRREAISLLQRSLPEVKATGYRRLISEISSILAQLSLAEGDDDAAVAYANGVTSHDDRASASAATASAYDVLYQVALRRHQFERALRYYRSYAEADKAYLDDVRSREYAFRVSQYELGQKNQSIALLKSQNQLLRLQQEAARASAWNTRLTIALLLVLIASLTYWVWRARRTHGSLRKLAETDGLTGLSNRRHFRARSEAALALCAQRRRPACVLLFDLDHFKQINDQCGHSSGDWVLREVARVGRLHCREQDLFGRIGGEEFAMTLLDCDTDAAMRIAEACRRSIEAIDPSVAGCALPVAASIGVVGTGASGYDYEALIAHADAAMYRSKVAGRNRVTLYEPPPVPQAGQSAVMLDRRNAEAMLKQY